MKVIKKLSLKNWKSILSINYKLLCPARNIDTNRKGRMNSWIICYVLCLLIDLWRNESIGTKWLHLFWSLFVGYLNLSPLRIKGAVLLDLDENDLPNIATRVVDHMVACDQIPPDQRDAVIKILLLKHKHIKEPHNAFKRAASKGSKIHLMG